VGQAGGDASEEGLEVGDVVRGVAREEDVYDTADDEEAPFADVAGKTCMRAYPCRARSVSFAAAASAQKHSNEPCRGGTLRRKAADHPRAGNEKMG
jgi:hypothetical protein